MLPSAASSAALVVPTARTWLVLSAAVCGSDVPCFHPVRGYQPLAGGPVFFGPEPPNSRAVEVSCGQCLGCRMRRSAEWTARCCHEASLFEANCFVTLTYDDDHLPSDGSLYHRHFQLFMKRLRRRFGTVRFYMCGEYGDTFRRPHFHACLFGFEPSDRVLFSRRDDISVYTSEQLSDCWRRGFVTVGDFTPETAAYVSRYVLKKVTGRAASSHYASDFVDTNSGEIMQLMPEYNRASLRPGLGSDWVRRYGDHALYVDSVRAGGNRYPLPRYYEKVLSRPTSTSPVSRELELELRQLAVEDVKYRRLVRADERQSDSTPSRLATREAVLRARLSRLRRSFDSEV